MQNVPWWKRPFVLVSEFVLAAIGLIVYLIGWAEVLAGFWALYQGLQKFIAEAPVQSKMGALLGLFIVTYLGYKALKGLKVAWKNHQAFRSS